jgi:hypothetical protein
LPVCDGCGCEADAQHIRARIERLELATRFRPVHIQVLLIDAAPPERLEDYFYKEAPGGSGRSSDHSRYCEELMQCAGTTPAGGQGESLPAEFQRRGFFLVHALECPVGNERLEEGVSRMAATMAKRVQYSYRPKHIALLSGSTQALVGALQESGWGDRLILDDGRPFVGPNFGERFREAISHV